MNTNRLNLELSEAIQKWDSLEEKTNKAPSMLEAFINFFEKDTEYSLWTFDGEHCDCGRQVTYDENRYHGVLCIEMAYTKYSFKAYTGRHEGYWKPEYISVHGEQAKEVLAALNARLQKVFFY